MFKFIKEIFTNFRYRQYRSRRIKIRGLGHGWSEPSERMLYGMFTLLEEYIEENASNYGWTLERMLAYSFSDDYTDEDRMYWGDQDDDWEEVKSLYKWWKEERPKRERPTDMYEGPHPAVSLEPVPGTESESGSVQVNIIIHPQYKLLSDKENKLEIEWHEEDQKQLKRLIDIRGIMWT